MKILYFAWIRTQLNTPYDILTECDILTESCATVSDVIAILKAKGGKYTEIFSHLQGIRVAVNQEFADFHTSVTAKDEIAFFPPVTGG